ncbi:glutamate 5-kinase [Vallitalea okinawensis]|uniref:glutamate 5-kinase n=1 Tax=Vallitalea okinawensis TaxID=2078660 RepID=UPI000CFD3DFC|nr:glutamate 5-kinase [Vallitalea okinawensis]
MESIRKDLALCNRIVVKIGSSSLTHETGKMNLNKIDQLARQLVDLKNRGKDIVLVSSGAIAAGRSYLDLKKPDNLPEKQAIAAVGQAVLMQMYKQCFSDYNQSVGQILLTKDAFECPERTENAKNTFEALFEMGVIPIVNENDTVATYEIEFGDNDTLSAIVSKLVGADLLILLSDIDGLYSDDPRANSDAEFIDCVESIDEHIWSIAGGSGSDFGTGGMYTKINAAKIATDNGIKMIIANACDMKVLHEIMKGEKIGTLFI